MPNKAKTVTGEGYKSTLLACRKAIKRLSATVQKLIPKIRDQFLPTILTYSSVFIIALLFSAVFFSATALFAEFTSSTYAESSSTNLSVNLEAVLSLRVAKDYNDGNGLVDIDELDLSLTPTNSGTFVKDDLSVLVSTSNETGYTLTLADNDTDTSMHHTEPTITSTIASLPTNTTPGSGGTGTGSTTDYTESTFPSNSWGYSLGAISDPSQTFLPIPVSTTPAIAKVTANPSTDDSTPITFATKVDTSVPAGTYQDTIVLSATTNYVPPEQASVTISPITTDQIDGGATFTLDTDIEWIEGIGQMIVTLYPASNVADTTVCTNPVAVKYNDGTSDKLRVTCTSPARTAGTYNVDLELLRFNTKYTATNSITYTNPYFNVTINKGTGIDQISGTNITATAASTATGQNQYTTTVTLNATLTTGYNTPTWTVTSNNATLSSTTGTSVSFTMPKAPVTVSVAAAANTYTIAYNGNGATSGSTAATTATYNAAHTLRANGFSRTNYVFLGWSTSSTATSATYSNSQALTTAQVNSLVSGIANGGTRTLYAVWRAAANLNELNTMQGMTTAICNATTVNTQKILTDVRDNKTYTVAKLADNKCWMTQNLRIGTSAITLTPADSDVTSNFTIPASAIQASGNTDWSTVIDSVHVYNNGNSWIQPTSSGNDATVNTTGTPPSQSQYIGNYYNPYTATAGYRLYIPDTTSTSICPKGWRLPEMVNTNEFQNLVAAAGIVDPSYDEAGSWKMQNSPYNFVLSGFYRSSDGVVFQGRSGHWLAVNSNDRANGLRMDSYTIDTQNLNREYYGYSIRCIAR